MRLIQIVALVLLVTNTFAQDCPNYNEALKKGNTYLSQNDYDDALKFFLDAQIAARECGKVSKEPAEGIKKVFDVIKAQRDMAVVAKTVADKARAAADSARVSMKTALENEKAAEQSKMQALAEKGQAQRLENLAEAKNDAHQAELAIKEKNFSAGLKYSSSAFEKNDTNGGPSQDNDIYNALFLSWENAKDNKQVQTSDAPVKALVALPDSGIIFSASNKGTIEGWRNEHGILHLLKTTNAGFDVRSLVASTSGTYLLAVGIGKVILYSIGKEGLLEIEAWFKTKAPGTHCLVPDDKYFIVVYPDRIARYQIRAAHSEEDQVMISNCSGIAAGDQGRLFISSGTRVFEYAGWEQLSKDPLNTYTLPSPVTCLSTDASGKYLAAGTYDGGIWLRCPGNNTQATYTILHRSQVNDIKFSTLPGGTFQLASASGDITVRLTEIQSDTLNTADAITLYEHENWVNSVAYVPGGKYLFSAGEDNTIRCWPTSMKGLYDNLTIKK